MVELAALAPPDFCGSTSRRPTPNATEGVPYRRGLVRTSRSSCAHPSFRERIVVLNAQGLFEGLGLLVERLAVGRQLLPQGAPDRAARG